MGGEKADEIFSSADLDPFDLKAPNFFTHGYDLIEKTASVLVTLYGEDTTRGLLIRMGGASMIFFRKYFSHIAQLGSIENRLKPIDRRFKESLEKFAGVLSNEMGKPISILQRNGRTYEWQVGINDDAFNNQGFVAYFFFGLLEEFCLWLDSRKNYLLNFESANAQNDPIEITIQIRDME